MSKEKNESSGIPYQLATFATGNGSIRMVANRGYVIAPQKILRCYRLNDIEKILLLEVISYMGVNNYAFPSHKRLAFKLGKKSTASIKNGLKSLKEKGFIHWSKGGGDLGTNHYRLSDLYSNPYIIMSEFTHFFVEEILDAHRGEISYEDIYSTVLQIVEKTKSIGDADDPYGICIDWLFKDINLRDRLDMYWLFGDILMYNISLRSNISIQIDTFHLVD
ncbi:helix-turn-helix domain-containing protein [Bacillus sp. FJAT-29790]|uniref:helix-turn-helix domain-containing protein n=1 Tax=Bacillus sp. FJAT-29790 TaxID=1895002 RepID=UPI001C227ED0|nr:helix-turn-helix domain-containing protein [Bacillus sp. FJAT-29790]MBU8880618.1 helix-turn-helix domain-containing protein [Bacillus sp. FJAT-29790]